MSQTGGKQERSEEPNVRRGCLPCRSKGFLFASCRSKEPDVRKGHIAPRHARPEEAISRDVLWSEVMSHMREPVVVVPARKQRENKPREITPGRRHAPLEIMPRMHHAKSRHAGACNTLWRVPNNYTPQLESIPLQISLCECTRTARYRVQLTRCLP